MLYTRILALLGALALLSACGGGDVAVSPTLDPADAQALEVAGLNGIWAGDYSDSAGTTCTDVQGLIYNGSVYAISEDCDVVLTGTLSISGDVASIAFDQFTVDGSSNGQSSFSGSYTLQSQINGNMNTGANLNLSYDIIYENDSAIALVAGSWGDPQGLAISVDAAGNIVGADINNCTYGGSISIIDANYNLYAVNVELNDFMGSCGSAGSYAGMVSVTDGANAAMTILVGNDLSIFFAGLSKSAGPT